MYDFLTGFMFWLALTICLTGMLVRIIFYFRGLNWKLDRVAYKAFPLAGFKGAVISICKWVLPFGTHGWRKQPLMTILFFGFHTGAILLPLFLIAHNLFLKEMIGISLLTLNPMAADILTWVTVISGLLIILRRIALPEVRILTTWYDYFILFIALAPFVTGLIARYELGNYSFWLTTHIFFGEVFLIAIPFTKLSHIVLFFASRAQLGMDFGIKRGGMNGTNLNW